MSLTVPVDAGTIPAGACPADYNAMAKLFAAVYSVTIPDAYTSVQVSPTKPTDTTKPWLQLDNLGRPVRMYVFAQGQWLSPHPIQSPMTMIYPGPIDNIWSFDGGDGTDPTSIGHIPGPYSGAMWQKFEPLNAKFPIGAGTLPSGVVVAQGATGGEEAHLLTSVESGVAAHTHDLVNFDLKSGANFSSGGNNDRGGNSTGGVTGGAKSAAMPHNTMPPYLGVFFVQRTARQFYTVSP